MRGQNSTKNCSKNSALLDFIISFQWLRGDADHSFEAWNKRQTDAVSKVEGEAVDSRDRTLKAKFFSKWKHITMSNRPHIMKQVDPEWLRRVIFNPSSRTARQVACNMVENFCNTAERTREMIDLTTSFLGDLGKAGEAAAEFVALYKRLIRDDQWKYYLSVSHFNIAVITFSALKVEK